MLNHSISNDLLIVKKRNITLLQPLNLAQVSLLSIWLVIMFLKCIYSVLFYVCISLLSSDCFLVNYSLSTGFLNSWNKSQSPSRSITATRSKWCSIVTQHLSPLHKLSFNKHCYPAKHFKCSMTNFVPCMYV